MEIVCRIEKRIVMEFRRNESNFIVSNRVSLNVKNHSWWIERIISSKRLRLLDWWKTQINTRKEEWKDGKEEICCMDNTFARSPTLICLFSNINISFCFVFQIKCNFYSILWNWKTLLFLISNRYESCFGVSIKTITLWASFNTRNTTANIRYLHYLMW